jgi:hypothetical protein
VEVLKLVVSVQESLAAVRTTVQDVLKCENPDACTPKLSEERWSNVAVLRIAGQT